MSKTHKDDDGQPTAHGDTIRFSFGVPPLTVTAKVEDRNGRLWALTPDCASKECPLDRLRHHVGGWWKEGKS